MKIGIFIAVAGREGSGPETYEVSLLQALARIDHINEYHVFCFSEKAKQAINIDQANFNFHILWPRIRPIATAISLQLYMLKIKLDFFHATFIPPIKAVRPYLFTMHGTDMFEHPEFFSKSVQRRLISLIKIGLNNSKKIICVSKHIQDFLTDKFNISSDRFDVVYHGVSSKFKQIPKEEAKQFVKDEFDIDRPYLLYVGKLVAGKNIDRLLTAFKKFKQAHQTDAALVLAGRSYPGMTDIENKLLDAELKPHLYRLGQVDHAKLPMLFSASEMFVFPTLCEGFGLPIIEAMACGTPVLTSDIPSLQEITEGNAYFFDPADTNQIYKSIESVYFDKQLQNTLIEKGLKRASFFTWENSAKNTLAIYETVYKNVKKSI